MKHDSKGSEEALKKGVLDTVKLDELVLTDPKNFREYAVRYTEDELLDALNQFRESPKEYNAIIQILKIQRELSSVLENDCWDDLNLKTLMDMFYANPDPCSYRHILMENGDKNPELTFKRLLLKYFTFLDSGGDFSGDETDFFDDEKDFLDDENDFLSDEKDFINDEKEFFYDWKEFLDEFKIDTSNSLLIKKLRHELEQDLKLVYYVNSDEFVDISSEDQFKGTIDMLVKCTKDILSMRSANGRLDGKKFIPWHCAYNDSPEWLELFGEDVVEYEEWDEYIPCDNHARNLSLINKVDSCSVEELEEMYLLNSRNDLESWKSFYKDNDEYIGFLKHNILDKKIDILGMYNFGDRFMVVKWTYQVVESERLGSYNRWCVDIRSQKTWEIYRVLSE